MNSFLAPPSCVYSTTTRRQRANPIRANVYSSLSATVPQPRNDQQQAQDTKSRRWVSCATILQRQSRFTRFRDESRQTRSEKTRTEILTPQNHKTIKSKQESTIMENCGPSCAPEQYPSLLQTHNLREQAPIHNQKRRIEVAGAPTRTM